MEYGIFKQAIRFVNLCFDTTLECVEISNSVECQYLTLMTADNLIGRYFHISCKEIQG